MRPSQMNRYGAMNWSLGRCRRTALRTGSGGGDGPTPTYRTPLERRVDELMRAARSRART